MLSVIFIGDWIQVEVMLSSYFCSSLSLLLYTVSLFELLFFGATDDVSSEEAEMAGTILSPDFGSSEYGASLAMLEGGYLVIVSKAK